MVSGAGAGERVKGADFGPEGGRGLRTESAQWGVPCVVKCRSAHRELRGSHQEKEKNVFLSLNG